MMKAGLLREGPSLPAPHPRRGHGRPVDATTLDRDISPDHVKALPPKDLAGARDVLDVRKPVVVVTATFYERRSGDTQSGVFGKFAQEELEVVGLERDVGVETSDHVEVQIPDFCEPYVET